MQPFRRHLLNINATVKDALKALNLLAADAILFIVDENDVLKGSLTDGDLRRGFLAGLDFDSPILSFIQPHPKFIQKEQFSLEKVISYRENNFRIIPVTNFQGQVVNVINFRFHKSCLPVDAVIMAGGRGERLKPLTDELPKPLLPVGSKPIIEYNIDRIIQFGINNIWISVRYLGDLIKNHLGDGTSKNARIGYVNEIEAMGTAGSLASVPNFEHDTILVMNSDLLTNIDLEDFYSFFQNENADLAVACIPYSVNIPYAVMETKGNLVVEFKEKPTYIHYSNAGIYLMKKSVIDYIPKSTYFDATDLMELLLANNKKIVAFPLVGYWLDIGKHDDYKKAQEDIRHIEL